MNAVPSLIERYRVLRDAVEALHRHLSTFSPVDEVAYQRSYDAALVAAKSGASNSELDFLLDDLRRTCGALTRDPTDAEAFVVLFGTLRALDDSFERADPRALSFGQDSAGLLLGRRFWHRYGEVVDPPPYDVPVLPESPLTFLRTFQQPTPLGLVSRVDLRFSRARRTGTLRIGLASLPSDFVTVFRPTRVLDGGPRTRTFGFVSEKVEVAAGSELETPAYLERIARVARQAADESIDVLLLPELSVCDEGVQVLMSQLAGSSSPPALVIAGSFHRQHQTGWQNRAPIFAWNSVERRFETPFSYDKLQPWQDSIARLDTTANLRTVCDAAKNARATRLAEDINIDRAKPLVAIATELGIFGVGICLDAVGPALLERLHGVIDHLLVISMNSTSAAGFVDAARQRAAQQWCATFYVNASQAIHRAEPVESGFWYLPTVGKAPGVRKKCVEKCRAPDGTTASPGVQDLPITPWLTCEIPLADAMWPVDSR